MRTLGFVAREAWRGLSRNLVSASAAVVALAVGLVLLGGALLVDAQVKQVSGFWFDESELSVFLCQEGCPPGMDQRRRDLEDDLHSDERIADVTFDSEQDAYHRLIESFEAQPNPLTAVSREQLPPSFRVNLHNMDDAPLVADTYRQREEVLAVVNRDDALAFPQTLLTGLRTGAFIWALLQLVAVAVLVANTVTQSVYVRREQLTIMRLVGASHWQTHLPLLTEAWTVTVVGWAAAFGPLVVWWPELSKAIVGDFASITPVGAERVLALGPALLLVGLLVTTMASVAATRVALRAHY